MIIRAGGKSELLQQVLMNYISEKIISIERKNWKNLLKDILEDRKMENLI